MKLVIQIPCFNEEATLPAVLAELPRAIPGIHRIEVQVVDDGSTDRTVAVAEGSGVERVVRIGSNRGLANAFVRGLEEAVRAGADIVVNTDGDNQYPGGDIPKLIGPILSGEADMVVGSRPIADHPEFGWIKKLLQIAGSWTLRRISKTRVRDAASGFRAFSRETCLRLFVYSRFSYCMETLIQAGNTGLRVASVEVGANPKTRESRLFRSTWEYLWKSGATILAMFVLYRPGRFFGTLGAAFFAAAAWLGVRFVYLIYLAPSPDPARTYIPSLILLSICALFGAGLVLLGVLGEIFTSLRRISEENLYLIRKRLAEGRSGGGG